MREKLTLGLMWRHHWASGPEELRCEREKTVYLRSPDGLGSRGRALVISCRVVLGLAMWVDAVLLLGMGVGVLRVYAILSTSGDVG